MSLVAKTSSTWLAGLESNSAVTLTYQEAGLESAGKQSLWQTMKSNLQRTIERSLSDLTSQECITQPALKCVEVCQNTYIDLQARLQAYQCMFWIAVCVLY